MVTYGRFERGRISEALYQRTDMQGLVAADSDQYIAMAVRLCLVGSLRTLLPAADSEERQPRPGASRAH